MAHHYRARSTVEQGLLWGAAERLDDELGDNMWRGVRSEVEEMLGERGPEFERCRADSHALALDEAVAIALASID